MLDAYIGPSGMRKVLLLTASFGSGHNQAARAVSEVLEGSGVTVKIVDYLDWIHPVIRSVAKYGVIHGIQKTPRLYGMFFRSLSNVPSSSSVQRRINYMGIVHLSRCLHRYRPDVVVCTFPTPSRVNGGIEGQRFHMTVFQLKIPLNEELVRKKFSLRSD
jgi:processive 1,2-diacylglycerol beta-glucosyltransferase